MIVLKPEIEIKSNGKFLELIDTFQKESVKVEINKDINEKKLLFFLRNGISLDHIERLTLEEKVVIKIFKSKSILFLIDVDKSGVKGSLVKSDIILTNLKTGTSIKKMESYLAKFDDTEIFIVDDGTSYIEELADAVQKFGFANVRVVKSFKKSLIEKKNNITIVAKEDLDKGNTEYISDVKYLCYSVKGSPEVGPIVIKNVTGCLECAGKSGAEQIVAPKFFPLMISLKIHYLFYLVDDLFTEVYQDVGLPLKKYYQFNTTNFEGKAYPFYRDLKCDSCVS